VSLDPARTLILVRHAKSAWPDVPDHERPLAPRGRRQAPLVGAWLRAAKYRPDLVLCSTARRARETWQLMSTELGPPAQVTLEDRVYGADVADLLELVRETSPGVWTLLLVGHDPGVQDLTATLASDEPRRSGSSDGPGDSAGSGGSGGSGGDPLQRVWRKFPTGAAAVLAVPAAWPEVAVGSAHLTNFVVPRDIER